MIPTDKAMIKRDTMCTQTINEEKKSKFDFVRLYIRTN